jgi:ACS family hexuronate transporter-like MFS transporter
MLGAFDLIGAVLLIILIRGQSNDERAARTPPRTV